MSECPLASPTCKVYAKVIIGNHSGQVNQGQPFMISTSQSGIGEATFTNRQSVKLINTSGGTQGTAILGTPPKAITLSQAQQMGLLSPSKLQQILPSSANKQSIILNKLVASPGKSNATKITMVPSSTVMKSPAKILPAPVGSITQLKPTSTLASGPTLSVAATSASTTFRPLNSPQKVIIRQSALKSGTVLTSSGTGQMIRIPATQNIIGTLPGGKQVQYVRLVSTANSSTANVVSHTKPRTTTVFPVNAVTGVSAPKPVAITTVRNQPQALKVVPIAPATSTIRTVVPKPTTTTQSSQRILIPTSTPATQLRAAPSVTTLSASGVNQLMPGTTILQSSTGNYVMLPAQYIQQIQNQQANQQQQQQQHVSVPPSLPPASSQSSSSSSQSPPDSTVSGTDSHSLSRQSSATRTTVEPNGIRPRKPCNCTKSQCLKLYCDCFANGEFCHMCNCNNCYNNLGHEEDRQRAIKSCLERNSNAFRPKIGKGVVGDERRHNKGCNCKRSGCLKNYCECYEAKISCSHNCKCVGCRNVEELCEKKSLRDLADAAEVSVQQHVAVKSKLSAHIESIASRSNTASGANRGDLHAPRIGSGAISDVAAGAFPALLQSLVLLCVLPGVAQYSGIGPVLPWTPLLWPLFVGFFLGMACKEAWTGDESSWVTGSDVKLLGLKAAVYHTHVGRPRNNTGCAKNSVVECAMTDSSREDS
uniref:CRC domain-containing protein n=1 Tax=Timema genevievae TaxID=629358 RepID=A0A7R9JY23_TIMGE|nr:unnamed protein product [Timema genevievae]